MPRWLLIALIGTTGWLNGERGSCQSTLCERVNSGINSGLRWPDFSDQRQVVDSFYASTNYAYAWTNHGEATAQARVLIEIIRVADLKGLNPEDYDASRWAARLSSLGSAAPPDVLDGFDLALTVSVMRYISDLHFGRLNPGLFHHSGAGERLDAAEFVRKSLVNAPDVRSALTSLEPPYPGYRRTQLALQKYLALGQVPDAKLPPAAKTIEPGQPYPGTETLALLLRRFGDLAGNAPSGPPGVYSEAIVDAVKRFQARHGLEPDGRIGKATLTQLNVPMSRRIQQLQLTLERWRWAPHSFARPPIVVNIPEFKLRALNSHYTTDLAMKVVVGGAYRHETPIFAASLKNVVFRPYWHVPLSIQRTELVPKLGQDRTYLVKNRFEIVTPQNKLVSDGFVDDELLARLRSAELRIRQVPGPENSLGLVAFMFPNEYDVYMHATPATLLFSKSRRDFSHGCIRVEKPEELAAWVLRDQSGWDTERISQAMNGDATLQVNLDRPIPVLIVYATAVVEESGTIYFFEDLYGQDEQMQRLLAKGYPRPTWKPTNGARGPRPRE